MDYRISEDFRQKLNKEVDEQARVTVGHLLRRIEVLQKERLSNEKFFSVFKKLVQEQVYEDSRVIKKLIKIFLSIGTYKSQG